MKAKNIIISTVAALTFSLMGISAIPAIAADSYKLDPDHTSIVFRVKHLGVAYVYGTFAGASGSLKYDENKPSNNSIEIQVNAAGLNTAVEKRDNHLRSPDFFNTDKFPKISFKSTSAKKIDDTSFEVSGDLSLLDKTQPITFKVVETGQGKDPWGNFRRGFETTFSIKRSDFGMGFMLNAASDEVQITVSLEGIRK